MLQPNYNTTNPAPKEEEIDLREQLEIYLQRWPWFVLGLLIALGGALLYLRYTTPTYRTVSTVIIEDEETGGGAASALAGFADMGGMFGGMGASKIENELGIFRSKRLMTNVAKTLDLNIRYFQEGTVRTTELFLDRPFNVQVLEFDRAAYAKIIEEEGETDPLFFSIDSHTGFILENKEAGWKKEVNFGEAFDLPYAKISVTPNFTGEEAAALFENDPVSVQFSSIEDAVYDYRERVQVGLTDKNSSLIELSLEDPVRAKAEAIIDQLVNQYNREAIEDKNLVSTNTAHFIEERLQIITRELDSVETGKTQFKRENQLTDIEAESQLFIENASEFRKRQLEVETQLELADTMREYLRTNEEDGLLPSNLGFEEEGVGLVIQSYNQLVLERDRILAGSTERNPVIINLNHQIRQLKGNVLQSLDNLRTGLLIARKDLNAQEAKIDAQIANVPSKEQEFRNIQRQQNIKEALYLYLLQKREETTLSLAATSPKAKIVDRAYSSREPVAPKSSIVLLAGGIMGLLVPFLLVYLKQGLSNKLQSRVDIERIIKDIPVIGEIPKIGRKEADVIVKHDRSVLAEAFRILFTNLQYLFINTLHEKGAKTILTTSTVKGEGKTFISMNLALTLAGVNNKVVLVGADIRNPQLQRYIPNSKGSAGVTEFLVNSDLKAEDLVQTTDLHPNLSILLSGSIPPNPAELWRQGRADELFASLREHYDYVIIDSAPSLLVTDTFLINQFADITLYVTRAGVTTKKMLEFPADAVKEGKLHDVAFVLNDVGMMNFGYGNKYGYAYDATEESFWVKVKRALRLG